MVFFLDRVFSLCPGLSPIVTTFYFTFYLVVGKTLVRQPPYGILVGLTFRFGHSHGENTTKAEMLILQNL